MGVILKLKQREVRDVVQAPQGVVKAILASGDRERLWSFFRAVIEAKTLIHDKVWLQMICEWAPEGGLSMKDTAPWMGLIQRVEALDDEMEGQFTLSASQSELIWRRLTNPDFKITKLSPAYSAFVMEYMKASKHNFETVTDEWEDPQVILPVDPELLEMEETVKR